MVETTLTLSIGTDHQFRHAILNAAQDAAVNGASWALSWMVKRRISHADDDALIVKATGSPGGIDVSGTYDAAPATNAQRAIVTIEAEDTDDLVPGVCYWELKRTDDGFETPLGSGPLILTRGVHRA